MRHSLKTNVIFWLSGCYAVFYVSIFSLVGYEATAYVMAGLLFGFSLIVAITWFSTAVEAVRSGGREGEAILAFCICLIAIYTVYTRLWTTAKLAMNSPDWMDTSPIGLGSTVLLLVFFTGVLFAPETREGTVPRKNIVFWAIALFAAGVFIGATVGITLYRSDPGAVTRSNLSYPIQSPTLPTLICADERPVLVRAYCRRR